jgi:hypothetical protein
MAVQPGIYNFTVQRAADHELVLIFKDSNGDAINLTSWTVASQVWNEARSTKYADFTVAYTDRANGKVTLSLSDEDTDDFPDELRYDVLLTDPNGLKEYYLEGVIFVDQGYTR